MQTNVAGLRRTLKNIAYNYSNAEIKVREVTSNDPCGPDPRVMARLARMTYHLVPFTEIMEMIWKRLSDHGKNWRHVHKALILLEYLIKHGTDMVGQQVRQRMYQIQSLREFFYYEDGKDLGRYVREKAKQLENLLKERGDYFFYPPYPVNRSPDNKVHVGGSLNDFRRMCPQTPNEEQLQLRLALAMSKEEARELEAKEMSDDLRLQLALSQSEQEYRAQQEMRKQKEEPAQRSYMLDLADISLYDTTSEKFETPSTSCKSSNNQPPYHSQWDAAFSSSLPTSSSHAWPYDFNCERRGSSLLEDVKGIDGSRVVGGFDAGPSTSLAGRNSSTRMSDSTKRSFDIDAIFDDSWTWKDENNCKAIDIGNDARTDPWTPPTQSAPSENTDTYSQLPFLLGPYNTSNNLQNQSSALSMNDLMMKTWSRNNSEMNNPSISNLSMKSTNPEGLFSGNHSSLGIDLNSSFTRQQLNNNPFYDLDAQSTMKTDDHKSHKTNPFLM